MNKLVFAAVVASIAVDFVVAQQTVVAAEGGDCEENSTSGGGMTTRTAGLCGHQNNNQLNEVDKDEGRGNYQRQWHQRTRGGSAGECEVEAPVDKRWWCWKT
jgi:hypothetical protein